MKKYGFYCFCALAVVVLVWAALSGHYRLLPGMFMFYAAIAFSFFTGDKSKNKNMPVCFTLLLTGISAGAVAIFLLVTDTFFVDYTWLKYLILSFAVVALVLQILGFYLAQKNGYLKNAADQNAAANPPSENA